MLRRKAFRVGVQHCRSTVEGPSSLIDGVADKTDMIGGMAKGFLNLFPSFIVVAGIQHTNNGAEGFQESIPV